MSGVDVAEAVDAHYGQTNRTERILEALRAIGITSENITASDLTPLDQLHVGGKHATVQLAKLAQLKPGERVLDVGGGIGGPARTIASEFGPHVTVLDLTKEFCRSGEDLTKLVGMSDRVDFKHGNALDIPFPDNSFDVIWTQHASMNIENKSRLFQEIHRVARPGGRYAFHEIMAGPNKPVNYPVPWAQDESISFLQPPDHIRSLLKSEGFGERTWNDVGAESIAFFEAMAARNASSEGPPSLSLLTLPGSTYPITSKNLLQNFRDNRVVSIQAVMDRY